MNRIDPLPLPPMDELTGTHRGDRSIGAILVDSGRLTPANAESILRFQKQHGKRFGDAALELGLLNHDDIRFALASQFDYPTVPENDTRLDRRLIAAFRPDASIVEQLRGLRSQLVLRWFEAAKAHKTLAVVSPGAEEGRSFIAANLAIVFSQLGERTLLIDADLRSPVQHELFKLGRSAGLSGILSGRAGGEAVMRVSSLRALSILPAGATPPNPQELLGRRIFNETLHAACRSFDVVIIDTPPASEYADALTVAVRARGALVVARKNRSSLSALKALTRNLKNSCTIVGSVLNDISR